MSSREQPPLSFGQVWGFQNFQQRRLQVLQIGLGTFGTFLHNACDSDEVYANLTWLLASTSDDSRSMLGVGVEPVPEHISALRPFLELMPNSSLVQAAVSRRESTVDVYSLPLGVYEKCLAVVDPSQRESFIMECSYVLNMSCVSQIHPGIPKRTESLESEFGVEVKVEAIKANALTYSGLSSLLQFHGVELLVIDAEGYDCQILESVIDYCKQPCNSHAWPDVIQFETMGHCDVIEGFEAEQAMAQALRNFGYTVVCKGKDMALVRSAALASQPRLRKWIDACRCDRCDAQGECGMPFMFSSSTGLLCSGCHNIFSIFGRSAWEWEELPRQGLINLATNGAVLWGVSEEREALCFWCGQWEAFDGHVVQLSVAYDHEMWGVGASGQVLRRRYDSDKSWTVLKADAQLKCVSVSCDGSMVCGIDFEEKLVVFDALEEQWHYMSGRLVQVSLSWGGEQIWGVNSVGDVFCRAGWRGYWETLVTPGPFRQVAISGNGHHLWGIDCDGKVWYMRVGSKDWLSIGGRLIELCVAYDGDQVWGICVDRRLWKCSLTM